MPFPMFLGEKVHKSKYGVILSIWYFNMWSVCQPLV